MNSRTLVSVLASLSLLTALLSAGCAETIGNGPSASSKSPQQAQVHRERVERDR